jgi:hypothetical protein
LARYDDFVHVMMARGLELFAKEFVRQGAFLKLVLAQT